MPTPDPSASLSAFQSWAVSAAGYGVELAAGAAALFVVGVLFIVFLLGALVVALGYRP